MSFFSRDSNRSRYETIANGRQKMKLYHDLIELSVLQRAEAEYQFTYRVLLIGITLALIVAHIREVL